MRAARTRCPNPACRDGLVPRAADPQRPAFDRFPQLCPDCGGAGTVEYSAADRKKDADAAVARCPCGLVPERCDGSCCCYD